MKTKQPKSSIQSQQKSEATHTVPVSTEAACYEGSAEHKSYPSPLGNAMLRSDATKCPTDIPYEAAKTALSSAIQMNIRDGIHSKMFEGLFPRYVWGRVQFGKPVRDICFEARLINRTLGQYKAWPIDEDHENNHLREEIRKKLWPTLSN